MNRINEYAPNLINGEDGFTVLARDMHKARRELLTMLDDSEFDRIDLVGSWSMDHWETQDKLERQTYY